MLSWILMATVSLAANIPVSGDPNPNPQGITSPEQELLTKYLLHRLLGKGDLAFPGDGPEVSERSDQDSSPSIIYPRVSAQSVDKLERPALRRLLDQAKESIDVIDFRKPSRDRDQLYEEHIRHTRMPEDLAGDSRRDRASASPSEAIPTFLPFPGTEPSRPSRSSPNCLDCVKESQATVSRFSMPLTHLGNKKYYLGIFFKANWYKAEQYCRFHGMHLASINKEEEQKDLEDHIESFGNIHDRPGHISMSGRAT